MSDVVIRYPPELPVSAMRDELLAAIRGNQVVIVAGETGSGKTTQLPKLLLEAGAASIAHTQPRRIAARSVAERIAEELETPLGGLVGYQVRFDDRVSPETRIAVMTDGVLLARLGRDRDLAAYDAIIVDEAHERSLNIDFLLGYLKRLLPRRPELKLVVTSATIDPEAFAAHFADAAGRPAPIIEVSGRTFPVEVRYRPLVDESDGRSGAEDGDVDEPDAARDLTDGILDALAELDAEPPGDVLVFLSGEQEIRDAADAVRGRFGERTEVLPLYGRLSSAEQHRVFAARPAGVHRRVVLATNVAETSLTVPGIRYVIDGGTARISRYSARAKVQRLPIEAISQASAAQRAGRAGRTSPGVAIRLYAEADFERRPEFTEPEILRTGLAAVMLQALDLGLGELSEFPFLQPPDGRGIRDARELLAELGAVRTGGDPRGGGTGGRNTRGGNATVGRGAAGHDAAERDRRGADNTAQLTRLGRELARLPLDPRFGRMLLESRRADVVREVAIIVAALTVQDVRERPAERREQADALHARFRDPTSDFLTHLNLWRYLEAEQAARSSSGFRRLCRAEFLNWLRIREWQDLVRQLLRAGRGVGLNPAAELPESSDADAIHRAMLAGLLSRIGVLDERTGTAGKPGAGRLAQAAKPGERRRSAEFTGARGARFAIHPGSALARKPPRAVMAAELVETSRLFAREVAAIDPAWAERLAGDAAKHEYSEPRWDARRGAATVRERVTIYGVPIVAGRTAQLSRIDPAEARELLIRHALVGGEWPREVRRDPLYDFDRANRRMLAQLAEREERERRRDLLGGASFGGAAAFGRTGRADDALAGAALDGPGADRLAEFYDARLPATVTSVAAFERWWREARTDDAALLNASSETLLGGADAGVDERRFPSSWSTSSPGGSGAEGHRLRLDYRFEPGAADDGVTVEVPLAVLPRVESAGFDWLVPGMREALVTALIRTLPKPIRVRVVPAADWARRLVAELPVEPDGELTARLAERIRADAGVPVSASDFDLARLPDHLRVSYAAVDARGRRLRSSKNLAELQRDLADRARADVSRVAAAPRRDPVEREGLRTIEEVFAGGDPIPPLLDARHGGNTVRGFPALVDEGASVAVRVLTTEPEQRTAHARGVRRLLALSTPSPAGYVREHLSQAEKLAVATGPYPSVASLTDDAVVAAIDEVLAGRAPRSRTELEALRDEVSAGLVERSFAAVAAAARVLTAARDADRAIASASALTLMAPLADARAQLDALVHPGFVSLDGTARLARVERYLRGLVWRVERLAENVGRDRTWQREIDEASALYVAAGGALPLTPDTHPRLAEVRWMLEELRLSLFAQHLGAAGPVSVQRIRKALAG